VVRSPRSVCGQTTGTDRRSGSGPCSRAALERHLLSDLVNDESDALAPLALMLGTETKSPSRPSPRVVIACSSLRNPGMALIAVLVREDRPLAFAARIATATVLARSRNLRRAARGPRPCGPSSGGMHADEGDGLGPYGPQSHAPLVRDLASLTSWWWRV